jgi:hypothetical protein
MVMSAGHEIALKGAADYGTHVFPAAFEPRCDAYRAVPTATTRGTTHFSARSLDRAASLTTLFAPTDDAPFPLSFFRNCTNQPTFADGKTCDNMIRLFNTSLSTAPHAIERVAGTVRATVHGLRLDTAFIENNYLPCEDFRGYAGVE